MENTIQPIHNNVQPESNGSFADNRAQQLAQIANTPHSQIPNFEREDWKKDFDYVKMKISFFFFTIFIFQFFLFFIFLSFFIIGIPFLVLLTSFYFDVRNRYKAVIYKLK